MPRYIDANDLIGRMHHFRFEDGEDRSLVYALIDMQPTADVVERSAYDQVRWERDTAIAQLASIGKGFGEKMDDVVKVVRCKDCKHWQTVVKNAEYGLCNAWHMLLTTGRDAYCSEARQREESDNG